MKRILHLLPVDVLLVLLVMVVFILLSLYKLDQLMPFIGDQAWFYLSARDLILHGQIPLVGITSSHTWLHQGPLWTYLLAGALWLGNFHPISGAVLTIGISLVTLIFLYKVTAEIFNKYVGYIALILYAFSPLVIENARFAYHTSPIPLFSMLFLWTFHQWTKGRRQIFPFVMLSISILYNFELATVVLIFLVICALVFGKFTRADWSNIFTRGILLRSLLYATIPMIPVLLYDLYHGFVQTVIFAGWLLVYKPTQFLFAEHSGDFISSVGVMLRFLWTKFQQLVSLENGILAGIILIGSVLSVAGHIKQRKTFTHGVIVLVSMILIAILGFVLNKTPSDAYLPLLYPWIIITVALFFYQMITIKQLVLKIGGLVLLAGVLLTNLFAYPFDDYTLRNNVNQITFAERVIATEHIARVVGEKPFRLIGRGEGSEFESFIMPYEYLLWWKGTEVSKNFEEIIVVTERNGTISIESKK